MTDWLGKVIGRVRIEKLLARGGMAEVYLGTHLTLERPVAIKLLQSHIEEEPELLERFHREAKVVGGLRHSNIVQIFDFDAIDGHPYIVMEYLRGPTLATYLRSLHEKKGRIPLPQVARLLSELASALDYAHGQGVIHRDIKPGNIMLLKRAGEFPLDQPLAEDVEIILTDFGLVRIAHATTHTAAGTVSGTPAYMSPEQARGDKTDHRTDIYSLGIVLYEMLAGRVPFEADSQLTVIYMHINNPPPPIPGVSEQVQAIIDRALAKDPNDRYQRSGEMAADFFRSLRIERRGEVAKETQVVAPEVHAAPPVAAQKPRPARSRSWLGVGVLSLICLLALGAGAWGMTSFLPSFSRATPTVPPTAAASPVTLPVPVTGGLPAADGMVKVAANTYEVGLSPADDYHMAPQQVTIKEFWIDQYQVTNDQYAKFMQDTGAPAPVVWPGEADHPVRGDCLGTGKCLLRLAEQEASQRGRMGGGRPGHGTGATPVPLGQRPNRQRANVRFPG